MKRYCLDREPNCTCLMCGDPEGSWVKYDEAKALQKELDELKASIPKIKADAVGEFLCELRYRFEGELTLDRIDDFADQLKGKE